MRINTYDLTLERNYLQKYQFLIEEYELIKQGNHPEIRFVQDFYKAHDTNRQSFLKYYNRYKQSGKSSDLLPRKRGPKWKTRRPIAFIEQKIIEERKRGNNRYEIVSILKDKLKKHCPSPSGVYNVLKRHGLNKLSPVMEKEKRRIIKEKAGELIHVDAHYLNKGIVQGDKQKYYLVSAIDSCTRLVWAELVTDLKALTVMFATMHCFRVLQSEYQIKPLEVLTDNGPEFGTKASANKSNHPFERLLIEMGVKHRYIKPYRPQTNGKIERFWKTIEDDLLRETYFESSDHLERELIEYLYYYNTKRPHMGINGKAPADFNQICQRIS